MPRPEGSRCEAFAGGPGRARRGAATVRQSRQHEEVAVENADRVSGWWLFAGILLTIGGVLNIIWGIAAIAESHFVTETGAQYVFSGLNTWGWITLILGVLELLAGLSLFGGGEYGRWFGIVMATLVAIDALLDIRVLPFWSICVFALSVIIIYQLVKAPSSEEFASRPPAAGP
jgi:hypothetical protein